MQVVPPAGELSSALVRHGSSVGGCRFLDTRLLWPAAAEMPDATGAFRLYEKLPIFLQNAACTAAGARMGRSRYNATFRNAYLAEIPREANGKFRQIVSHVFRDRHAEMPWRPYDNVQDASPRARPRGRDSGSSQSWPRTLSSPSCWWRSLSACSRAYPVRSAIDWRSGKCGASGSSRSF